MDDNPEATVPPRSDHGAWLSKFQILATNVRGWVASGQSETAVREIDALWCKWKDAESV